MYLPQNNDLSQHPQVKLNPEDKNLHPTIAPKFLLRDSCENFKFQKLIISLQCEVMCAGIEATL